jgi:Berberine and berberine like
VGGLTLGGGQGYLTRKHGLTIDNLLSADVVLADGSFVRADDEENADLSGRCAGGAATSGSSRGCWAGSPADADEVLAPSRALSPSLDGVVEIPFPASQTAFDALYPPGLQNYWRAHLFDELSDEAMARHVEWAEKLPTLLSGVLVYPVDGAAARVGSMDTAWSHRAARWSEVIFGTDPDPANFELLRSWTIGYWEALQPYSLGGAYVNFMDAEGDGRIRSSYGTNYDRRAELKARYDPGNVFHVNQNIEPAV